VEWSAHHYPLAAQCNGGLHFRFIDSTIYLMKIDYDPAKNARNVAERQLPFDLARTLDMDNAVITQDVRKAYPEDRFVALAMLGTRLHALCFTPIAGGIRVISFRKANAKEVKRYERTHAAD